MGGILFFALTGIIPASLADGAERLPHQRDTATAKLAQSAGHATTALFAFFDKAMNPNLRERYATASQMKKALESVLEARAKHYKTPEEEDMAVILAHVGRATSQQQAVNSQKCREAIKRIGEIHTELKDQFLPTYVSFQGDYGPTPGGIRCTYGFWHFERHDEKFAPVFVAKVLGGEIVLSVDTQTLYRTEIEVPSYGEDFTKTVRALFVRGLRSLIDESPALFHTTGLFKTKPFTSFADAKLVSGEKNLPLFLVVFDEQHKSLSKLSHSLGYFMEYETTKDLVDSNFVVALIPSSQVAGHSVVPEDDPLENARLIIFSPDGAVMRSEGAYANPDVGLERIRQTLAAMEADRHV